LWLLSMTLWLPVIDYGKTYRLMVAELKQAMPAPVHCVASRGLGEPQRAMLHYFGQLMTRRVENGMAEESCALLLVQSSNKSPIRAPANGQLVWQGARPGDSGERFALFRMGQPGRQH
ncbi:MAG: hypothetical protein H7838_09090, partial [Magnetococcus sp. DMHC-8]